MIKPIENLKLVFGSKLARYLQKDMRNLAGLLVIDLGLSFLISLLFTDNSFLLVTAMFAVVVYEIGLRELKSCTAEFPVWILISVTVFFHELRIHDTQVENWNTLLLCIMFSALIAGSLSTLRTHRQIKTWEETDRKYAEAILEFGFVCAALAFASTALLASQLFLILIGMFLYMLPFGMLANRQLLKEARS